MSDTTQNADLPRDYHARKAAERILGDADDLFATGGELLVPVWRYSKLNRPACAGNPRERSLPGKGPGEKQYAKTRDQTGRMISEKPANKPFLAWQRYKAAEAEKERRRAAGEVLPEDVPKPWTLSSYLLGAFFTIGFIGYVGNWVTGSPAWGYEAQIAKQWKQVNPWRVSRASSPTSLPSLCSRRACPLAALANRAHRSSAGSLRWLGPHQANLRRS